MMEYMLRQPDGPQAQAEGGELEAKARKNVSRRAYPLQDPTNCYFFSNATVHELLPQAALVRDDFRCVVSGTYDSRSVCRNRELKEEALRSRPQTCLARCAYILPSWQHSTSSRTEPNLKADISGLDAVRDGAKTGSGKVRFQRTVSLPSGHK